MNISAVNIRLVSYAIAGAAVLTLPPDSVVLLFVYLGQAHFLLSYWYKFQRPQPYVSKVSFWIAMGLSVLLFVWYSLEPHFALVVALAALLFVAHFIVDEINLLHSPHPPLRNVAFFLPTIFLFLVEIWQVIFSTSFALSTLITLAIVAFLTSVIIARRNTQAQPLFFWYITSVAAISSGALCFANELQTGTALGFIILSHYFIWYLEYACKLRSGSKFWPYLQRVVGVNGLMGFIWLLTATGSTVPFHEYFFTEPYFYLWTCAHIFFSFVPKATV